MTKKCWKVKITVVKLTTFKEIYGDNAPLHDRPEISSGKCPDFKEGQEFIIDNIGALPPQGFCAWAWSDIYRHVYAMMLGGDPFWMKETGACLTCCTDGLNPVMFKVERIEPAIET